MSGRFELHTFLDLYAVVLENKQTLEDNALTPMIAFNILGSINCLTDWLKKDDSISQEIKEKAQGLRTNYDTEGETLNIIRKLCNAQKHFGVHDDTPDTSVVRGFGAGRYGVGLYGVGEPSYTVQVEDDDISFLALVDEAVDLWQKFIEENFNESP